MRRIISLYNRIKQRQLSIFMIFVMVLSILTPFVPSKMANADETVEETNHIVRLTYEREDQNYDGWDVWVWNTGVKENDIAFDNYDNDVATAFIEVADQATKIGYKVRKGDEQNDWLEAEPGGDGIDREIPINRQDSITKVTVTQGKKDVTIVPGIPDPVIEDGHATFYYRDKDLYAQDQMDQIDEVALKINDEKVDMTYEQENERYVYKYEDFPVGTFDYTFIVTKEGKEEEVKDPYFESSSIENIQANLDVAGSVNPSSINYNEQAVLEIDLTNEGDVGIREIYADTSSLGGSSKLKIDPQLNAVTISVKDDIVAGEKNIPFTVIDVYGGIHEGETTVEVKPLQSLGDDDFTWDEAVIYFMLTDRFFDGDTSNNDPYHLKYDTDKRGTYQGGDFKGITQKLDYLDELGINTIWISPIVENIKYDVGYDNPNEPYYGYHGYWASNFGKLNPHFGTINDFKELIDEAADRNIKIMVDVVLNHTGYGLKEIDGELAEGKQPKGYPTDDERDIYKDLVRQGHNVGDDEVKGELSGLPDFKTEEPEVRQQIIDWQTDWIEKSTTDKGNKISYFRVDTVKHVEDTTWQSFKNELTKKDSSFKMIGEAWGASYQNDYGYLRAGTMDSLLDFGFKSIAQDFVDGKLEQAQKQLENRNKVIDHTATLGQFLGSHDEDGFLYGLDGDKGKFKVASALQMTAKGQPVIYYGEELGLTGENNYPYHDNRYDMAWDQVENNDMLDHYQKVLNFRSSFSDVLSKGDRNKIVGSNSEKLLFFERNYQDESVYVGLNLNEEAREITLELDGAEAIVTDHYSNKTYKATNEHMVSITIPGRDQGGTALIEVVNGKIIGSNDQSETNEIPEDTLRVHYENKDKDYSGLGLWVWEDVQTESEETGSWPTGATPFTSGYETDFGVYVDIPLAPNAKKVGMLVNHTNGDNLTGDIMVKILAPEMNEIWLSESGDVSLTKPTELKADQVRIHYQRDDGEYEPWGIWTWEDVLDPTDDWPIGAHAFSNDQVGKNGAYIDIDLIENAKEIGLILLEKVEDGKQTNDMLFSELDKYNQLFIREGDETIYTNPYYVLEDLIEFAELVSLDQIEVQFISLDGITEKELQEEMTVVDKDNHQVEIEGVAIDGNKVIIDGLFDINKAPYSITFRDRTIKADKSWRLTDERYSYDGDDLGVTLHTDGSATLKLWSPSADKITAILYGQGDKQDEIIADDIEMTLGDRGVWEVRLDKENTGLTDLTGYYYHYEIERDGEKVLALDPYAKSMATWNSENTDNIPVGKAAIVDPSAIGPALDFADIDGYEKREDAIIYEVHVRDFTSDPTIANDLTAEFGTFPAFVEKLDYLEDLGVTHIQLLPVMSYFFANEFDKDERLLDYSSTNNNYNWGYDPHSYFSLTGMYSEQPDDPEKRIEEFKLLVHEIHSRGMGVVLDVVYNHTARINLFEDLEPNYYHFMNADGSPRESFGGGRLGTTHEMARKILVDSILYWVDEFKIDGFRFDMMGDHDAETIQIAFDEAQALNSNIVMIGEGWVTYVGDENGGDVMPADQQWMKHTQAVGSFSDDMRNELKSGFGSEGEPRFLTGGARNIEHIFDNVTANPHNFKADDPGDVVSYIAAHDNLTLHDVIAQSIKKDPKDHQEEIHQRIRLGNTMVLTAQGTSFLHAGQEFGRTKQFMDDDYKEPVKEAPYKSTYMEDVDGNPFEYPYFIHDSYDSTDAVNRIDWEKTTNKEVYPIHVQTREYTKGLIDLRRSTDAFRLGTMDEIAENVSMIKAPEIKDEDLMLGYKAVSSDDSETYYVFVNADDEKRTLTLGEDLTKGIVIVDSEKAGIHEISDPTGIELTKNQIMIDPLTAVVIKLDNKPDEGDQPGDKEEPGEGEKPVDKENPEEGYKPGDQENPKEDDQPGDKDKPGDEKRPDEKSEQDKTNKDKVVEPVIKEDQDGKELPTTATNIFNYFIIGVLLLVCSLSVLIYRKRANKEIR